MPTQELQQKLQLARNALTRVSALAGSLIARVKQGDNSYIIVLTALDGIRVIVSKALRDTES